MTEEMSIYGDVMDVAAELSANDTQCYCSMKVESKEDKMRLFNAMTNPDHRLGDCINDVIAVKDIYAETVYMKNEDTGIESPTPRVILIADNGESYACVSVGVFSSIKKMIAVFGAPTWEEPIKVKVLQLTKGNRKMLTLSVVA